MPIEDVDFMRDNGVADSAVFVVDSARRDRRFNPHVGEYVVEFTEPVRNVTGIDVLDASLSGTMYNVDAVNNMLRAYTFDASTPTSGDLSHLFSSGTKYHVASTEILAALPRVSAAMDVVRPSLKTVAVADVPSGGGGGPDVDLRTNPTFSAAAIAYVRCLPAAVFPMPADKRRTLLSASGPRVSFARGYSAPAIRVIRDPVDPATVWFWASRTDSWYGTSDPTASGALWSSISIDQDLGADATCAVILASQLTLDAGVLEYFAYVSHFQSTLANVTVTSGQSQDVVLLAWTVAVDSNSSPIVHHTMTITTAFVEPANYSVATLAPALASASGLAVEAGSLSGQFDRQTRYALTRAAGPFVLDMDLSTMQEVLGFDTIPREGGAAQDAVTKFSPDGVYASPVSSWRKHLFASAPYDKPLQRIDNATVAPGVVNLQGFRYVTLRCKEVEDHIHGSLAYASNSVGVGIFKLPSPNEVAQLRFDYTSLVRRPFHPIGKLARLTLRFELSDGTLYDFKGVNHHLVLIVRYFSPPPAKRHATSTLNANYDPDYVAYLGRLLQDEAHGVVPALVDADVADVAVQRGGLLALVQRGVAEEARFCVSSEEEG